VELSEVASEFRRCRRRVLLLDDSPVAGVLRIELSRRVLEALQAPRQSLL
jgi:ferric-dicitrate binding protein FerR (iron transport regulator)